jgi:hypothetical protein
VGEEGEEQGPFLAVWRSPWPLPPELRPQASIRQWWLTDYSSYADRIFHTTHTWCSVHYYNITATLWPLFYVSLQHREAELTRIFVVSLSRLCALGFVYAGGTNFLVKLKLF